MKNLIINIPFQGFYESLFSGGIDQAEEFTIHYEVEEKGRNPSKCADAFYKTARYRKAHLYVAQKYVEYFNKYVTEEFGLDLELTFESLQSPREYNFETDRIFCFISPEKVQELRAKVSDGELQIAINYNELGTLLVALLGEGGDWEQDIFEDMQDENVFDAAFDNCVDWEAYENFVMEDSE